MNFAEKLESCLDVKAGGRSTCLVVAQGRIYMCCAAHLDTGLGLGQSKRVVYGFPERRMAPLHGDRYITVLLHCVAACTFSP